MNILHICSPHLSDVASSHFNLGNPKKSFFSTVSFVHTSDLPFLRRKQIATAALQLSCLLLLFTYYLHIPITASGARYMRSACIEYQSAIRASYDSGFCDMGWFQHSVVYDAIDQWWTKTGACIHAEGGHFEHLLWRCLSVASCHTSQPALLRATNNIWKNTTSLQSHKKSFALHQLVWWHFQVGGASGLQFILFWDNVNSHKYIRIILLKMTFSEFQGKVATTDKRGGQICKILMSNYLRI